MRRIGGSAGDHAGRTIEGRRPTDGWGGLLASALKKSLDAVIADAAVRAVLPSVPIAVVRAAWKLVAVSAGVAPMVNSLAPGGESVVAVSVRFSLVPSGRLRRRVTVWPGLGIAEKSMLIDAGEPAGPDTVAPVTLVVMEPSLKPNGDTESSSTPTEVAVGALTTRRPSPSRPRSA